jgi:hypothetical protein
LFVRCGRRRHGYRIMASSRCQVRRDNAAPAETCGPDDAGLWIAARSHSRLPSGLSDGANPRAGLPSAIAPGRRADAIPAGSSGRGALMGAGDIIGRGALMRRCGYLAPVRHAGAFPMPPQLLRPLHQLRQPGDIDGDAPRFVARQ